MPRTIAVFGGSFNPPGVHHRKVVESLRGQFDGIVVVPCGPRPDKPSLDAVPPVFRAAMADMAFRHCGAEIDLFDLEHAVFTPTHELQHRYRGRGEVWHVVRRDLVLGGGRGQSAIQRSWINGPEVWESLNFVVVVAGGREINPRDLPPRHRVLRLDIEGNDDALRERVFRGESLDGLVTADVSDFITRRALYQGRLPSRLSRWKTTDRRMLIVADEKNPKAREWAEKFRAHSCPHDPNCVLVLGGDGTMLHAIQRHWRLRVPFFGINAGHLGFLLNDAERVLDDPFPPQGLVLRHLPLLYVEMQTPDGAWRGGLSFNDAWIERAGGQTAWLEVKIDDNVRLPKVVCDGVLLSTAAGSTAYARAMGATPLLPDTPA